MLDTLRRFVSRGHRGRVTTRLPRVGRIRASASDDFARDDFDGEGRYQGRRGATSTDDAELTEQERAMALRNSRRSNKRSGVYGAVIDRLTDFVLGDGIAINVRDKTSHEWLHELLETPGIAWTRNLRRRYQRLLVDGELPLLVKMPERAGQEGAASTAIRMSRLAVEGISDVMVAEDDDDEVVAVTYRGRLGSSRLVLPMAAPGEPMLRVRTTPRGELRLAPSPEAPDGLVRLRQGETVVSRPRSLQQDPAEVARSSEDDETAADAYLATVALWQVNTVGRRGAPMLTRILDKSDLLDDAVGQMARRQEYLNRFYALADYAAGGDEAKNKALEKRTLDFLTGLDEGAALVVPRDANGDPQVRLKIETPDLKPADQAAAYELLLDYVLGAHGIPRSWYSSGGDTNRATAVEQGTPIFRSIRARQAELKACVEDLVRYLLWLGSLSTPGVKADAEIEVVMADLATRDSLRDVEEVAGIAVGMREVVAMGAATAEEAIAIVRQVLKSKAIGETLEHGQDGSGDADEDVPEGPAVDTAAGDDVPRTELAPVPDDAAQEMRPPAPVVAPDPEASAAGAGAVTEKPADAVWTGVQITALTAIVEKVAGGLLPAASAIEIVLAAFPLTREEAARIINPAAAQEAEAAEEPQAPPTPPEPPAPAAGEEPAPPEDPPEPPASADDGAGADAEA